VGFEPTISAGEGPQTYALDRTATGTGTQWFSGKRKCDYWLYQVARQLVFFLNFGHFNITVLRNRMIDYSDLDQNNGVHYFHCAQEHGNIILRTNTYNGTFL